MAVALALHAVPFPSFGQQPAKVYRIGWLGGPWSGYSPETDDHQCPIQGTPAWQGWLEGLREYGYVPGQNLVIECRYTAGHEERAPALAAELVRLAPDLIVAHVSAANLLAAKQATSTLPIVFVDVTDPVGRGLVPSLAHPGGNATGVAYTVGVGIVGKQLQYLTEALPQAARVAVLGFVSSVPTPGYRGEYDSAARARHVTLQRYPVQAPEDLPAAFAAMRQARAQALVTEPYAFMAANRQQIVALAAQHRLPTLYNAKIFVEIGGLMAYAPDSRAMYRRLGYYVDKIFHGANPGDLPVEQPTKFELVINLKTAKTLGLTSPPSLLMRADEVIR